VKSRKARRIRQNGSVKIRIEIPKGMKFTTLPSADVLLDPNMVKEILAAREKEIKKEEKSGRTLSKAG
jgi:hypothetical protein